ncbi:MAG TPA: energy-coupling factor ABC transporter permease [Burkholderiaceae bacterium]|nr:energy-coupling factor ABC transporter permease [Burkholderiaceae bacterium]
MHLSSEMVSPTVAGVSGLVAAAALGQSARHVRANANDRTLGNMAALGALVFALQMVNVAIPGTGSSGHFGGGVLLAMMLGPHAGLLVMAAVLAVQALLLGDGGVAALGANLVNLGVVPCLVVAPLLARATCGATPGRTLFGTVVACMLGLQLGALGVVAQTAWSGTAAPAVLAASLLPIHLPVGFVEGLLTAAGVLALRNAPAGAADQPLRTALSAVALVIAGVLVWFTSPLPDTLQWSLARALSSTASAIVPAAWPRVDAATSVWGLAGVLATSVLIAAVARALRWRALRKAAR